MGWQMTNALGVACIAVGLVAGAVVGSLDFWDHVAIENVIRTLLRRDRGSGERLTRREINARVKHGEMKVRNQLSDQPDVEELCEGVLNPSLRESTVNMAVQLHQKAADDSNFMFSRQEM